MTRVAFFELQRFRPVKTDWSRIISELNEQGVTCTVIGDVIGTSRKTVHEWKGGGMPGPRHGEGAAILAMHAHYCGDRAR